MPEHRRTQAGGTGPMLRHIRERYAKLVQANTGG